MTFSLKPMAQHTEGPRVIRCKGSWLEMGRQYGEELRAEIANASHAIEELAIAAGYDRVSLKARINDYIPCAQELPARWDELAGVAQGSCLAIEDVLLMQMLEDLLEVDACTTAGRAGFWTAPGSLEAVTSGKVGAHGIQKAASR